MQSKNKPAMSQAERAHLERVKSLACSLCDAPPPSDAHHIKQGAHFSAVALCKDCHQNSRLGWHGERRMWAIKKMDEHDALYVTVRRLQEARL